MKILSENPLTVENRGKVYYLHMKKHLRWFAKQKAGAVKKPAGTSVMVTKNGMLVLKGKGK